MDTDKLMQAVKALHDADCAMNRANDEFSRCVSGYSSEFENDTDYDIAFDSADRAFNDAFQAQHKAEQELLLVARSYVSSTT